MEIKIQIDEEELINLVTQNLAKQLTTNYSAQRNMFKKEISDSVRAIIYTEKEMIIDEVIHRATTEIKRKALPKLLENLSE